MVIPVIFKISILIVWYRRRKILSKQWEFLQFGDHHDMKQYEFLGVGDHHMQTGQGIKDDKDDHPGNLAIFENF